MQLRWNEPLPAAFFKSSVLHLGFRGLATLISSWWLALNRKGAIVADLAILRLVLERAHLEPFSFDQNSGLPANRSLAQLVRAARQLDEKCGPRYRCRGDYSGFRFSGLAGAFFWAWGLA